MSGRDIGNHMLVCGLPKKENIYFSDSDPDPEKTW